MKKLILIIFIMSLGLSNLLFAAYSDGTCTSGDCMNGEGTEVFTNGDKYVGQFKDGYMNGGTMTFSTGEVVENYYDEQYE